MPFDHRLIYKTDVGLFLVLAIPGLNAVALKALLSTGDGPFMASARELALLHSLLGIAGVLGLGLALLRLHLPDSRHMVVISLMVKVAAAGWLLFAYTQQAGAAFALLAIADIFAAALFITRLYRH